MAVRPRAVVARSRQESANPSVNATASVTGNATRNTATETTNETDTTTATAGVIAIAGPTTMIAIGTRARQTKSTVGNGTTPRIEATETANATGTGSETVTGTTIGLRGTGTMTGTSVDATTEVHATGTKASVPPTTWHPTGSESEAIRSTESLILAKNATAARTRTVRLTSGIKRYVCRFQ